MALALLLAVTLAGAASALPEEECASGACPSVVDSPILSEDDALREVDAEASELALKLLQHKVTPTTRDLASTSSSSAAAKSEERQLTNLDHNNRSCILCAAPPAERFAEGRVPTGIRMDCGNQSSATGPSRAALTMPVAKLVETAPAGSNGFCELNFAKGCADAIHLNDYMYWAKTLDMRHPELRKKSAWDAAYCHRNGFLDKDIVALQHNFTGMHAKAKELCESKYEQRGARSLSFLDLVSTTSRQGEGEPSQEDAELLAAWNCGMGDLGCEMAWCAYSFCRKSSGEFGLYDECDGWDPVQGMPIA